MGKKNGYQQRIVGLKKLKENHNLLSNIKDKDYKPLQKYKDVYDFILNELDEEKLQDEAEATKKEKQKLEDEKRRIEKQLQKEKDEEMRKEKEKARKIAEANRQRDQKSGKSRAKRNTNYHNYNTKKRGFMGIKGLNFGI